MSEARIRTGLNFGQARWIDFVAHGRTHVGVDRNGNGRLGSESVRDAADVLAVLGLDAMRIQRADHVARPQALALRNVARGLRTSVPHQVIRAEISNEALLSLLRFY